MKVIIAGSRNIRELIILETAIDESGWADDIKEVVSGCAKGVDTLGEEWAYKTHRPVKRFPADWENYGRSAGIRRNCSMAAYADALLAVWDGQSKGTANMIAEAKKQKLKVFVYEA